MLSVELYIELLSRVPSSPPETPAKPEFHLEIHIRPEDIYRLNEDHRFYLWSSLVQSLPEKSIAYFNSNTQGYFGLPDVDGIPSRGRDWSKLPTETLVIELRKKK